MLQETGVFQQNAEFVETPGAVGTGGESIAMRPFHNQIQKLRIVESILQGEEVPFAGDKAVQLDLICTVGRYNRFGHRNQFRQPGDGDP